MRQLILSPRLQAVASLVDACEAVCDVGTDHAFVPISLVQKGTAQKAIAADVRKGPLLRAEKNILKHGLSQAIEARLGNGLAVVKPFEVQTAIFAGMGGLLMCELLDAQRAVVDTLEQMILQPMLAVNEVRKWLYQNGWHIEKEQLVKEEDKLYHVLCAKKGWVSVTDEFLFFEVGERLFSDSLFAFYVNRRKQEIEKILTILNTEETTAVQERKAHLEATLTQWKKYS